MAAALEKQLRRWVEAGLLSEDAAAGIRAWEAGRAPAGRWRWPVWVAVALGTLTLGAGVLLFVAAHWDEMGTAARMTLVLAMTGVFHAAGAWVRRRSEVFALAAHGLGTVAFGAGISLLGRIFYLEEHWPGASLLWAAGA